MHPNNKEETTFVTEWEVFVAVMMMFGLKTTPIMFQRIIMEIFGEYILAFMQVFLDDFVVYIQRTEHLDHLQMCLEKCRSARLSQNLAKCAFGVTNDTLLGHILSKEGIATDLDKIDVIFRHQHRQTQNC